MSWIALLLAGSGGVALGFLLASRRAAVRRSRAPGPGGDGAGKGQQMALKLAYQVALAALAEALREREWLPPYVAGLERVAEAVMSRGELRRVPVRAIGSLERINPGERPAAYLLPGDDEYEMRVAAIVEPSSYEYVLVRIDGTVDPDRSGTGRLSQAT